MPFLSIENKKTIAPVFLGGLLISDTVLADAEPLTFSGLVQLDVSDASINGPTDVVAGDLLRAFKFNMKSRLSQKIELKITVKTAAGSDFKFDDSYLSYKFDNGTVFTAGYYKAYHSLTSATSENENSFSERSLASNAFEVGAGGLLGLYMLNSGQNWSLQTGLTFNDLNKDTEARKGWGLHARATFAPYLAEDAFVHLGFASYFRDEKDNLLQISAQPETWLEGVSAFNSSPVEVTRYAYANAEMAFSRGGLLVQAEYSGLKAFGEASSQYTGGYVQASYVLTGEHRRYEVAPGSLDRLYPSNPTASGGVGALEIATRYSHLDLRDNLVGNKGHNWSLSLNWYPSHTLRFMLNYTDHSVVGDHSQNGHSVGLRTQWVW